MSRPLKTYVDLEAIKHNYLLAKSRHPNHPAFAVVKANAYGHGAVRVSRYLDDVVDAFAVAAIEEALALREHEVKSPVFLLEGIFSADELALCEAQDFWVAIENERQLNAFLNSDVFLEKVFVKVDTGMHRLGVQPEQLDDFVDAIQKSKRVGEVLLMTHFSSADDLQNTATSEQLACFENVCRRHPSLIQSCANSAALLKWQVPEKSWLRPGIMLYGISPFEEFSADDLGLKPAMSFESEVISLRVVPDGESVGYSQAYQAQGDRVIATVAVGYGDGYPRTLDFETPVLVNDQLCYLAGRVSMDMITVDVTHLTDVRLGDAVVLWGKKNPVEQVASHANTIGYELVTRMTGRSSIRYLP